MKGLNFEAIRTILYNTSGMNLQINSGMNYHVHVLKSFMYRL